MIENKYKEFWEIIDLLDKENALNHLIVIGSWAEYLYEQSGLLSGFRSELRTRDIDFVIRNKRKPNSPINLTNVFDEAGYIVEQDRITGKTRILTLARLEVEFLLAKVGAGLEGTMETNLGIIAETLRNIDILRDNFIPVSVKDYVVNVPKPEAYIIQKMVINDERGDKSLKDQRAINNILPYINK
ncbi:MAG TPA: GSU2403 family nucleotidyltransferase fold protein, partial [Myxococcota bacterium]|nr:GSU2403 family nucleotidyltransferase fold protein [Myxococcota bacterium]